MKLFLVAQNEYQGVTPQLIFKDLIEAQKYIEKKNKEGYDYIIMSLDYIEDVIKKRV